MYESRSRPPIPLPQFLRRVGLHALVATALLALSLGIGMAGYSAFEGLNMTDAFLNASMLLGGMGPVDAPRHESGKIFAGLYALYSGLVFLVAAGLIVAPLAHRLLHRFHWEDDSSSS